MRLDELQQIGQTKRAWSQLSQEARDAIEGWESTNWTGGALEQHVRANDAVAQDIDRIFAPIRATLNPTVHLYRGLFMPSDDAKKTTVQEFQKTKFLESWTSDRKVAEHFAGLRTTRWKSVLWPVPTDREIAAAITQYDTTGFVKFGRHKYVRIKDQDPEFVKRVYPNARNAPYWIYTGSERITDGDDLYDSFKDDADFKREQNQKKLDRALILEEDIPRERIIWITNNLDSKEFIVRKSI